MSDLQEAIYQIVAKEVERTEPKRKENFLSKKEQMKYKFIISLEGNDVASNLKWEMNSNSLVLAPKITCETWFMEGTLKPNYHFALIDNDNLATVI